MTNEEFRKYRTRRDTRNASHESATRSKARREARRREGRLNIIVGSLVLGLILGYVAYSNITFSYGCSHAYEKAISESGCSEIQFSERPIKVGDSLKGISNDVARQQSISSKTAFYLICEKNGLAVNETNNIQAGSSILVPNLKGGNYYDEK